MTASFNLVLDTQAPANPSLLINGGAAATGDRDVWLRVATADFGAGANDVFQMKVWGDVEPFVDSAIGAGEFDSQWLPFAEQVAVRLSPGQGRKHVSARLRDDVGNETPAFTDFIDYDTSIPVVTVLHPVDRSRISKVEPYDAATFTWEASVPIIAYQVRVVPSHGSPYQAGVPIRSAYGSENTVGNTVQVPAHTPIITTIRGADLEAASPGNTEKIVKVFAQDATGVWSA